MSKITLISPYSDFSAIAVRILSAYVRSKGFKSRLIFFPDPAIGGQAFTDQKSFYSAVTIDSLIDLCSDSSIIGFSLFSSDFLHVAFLTKCLKKRLSIPVIWGGKYPSAKPELSLSYADMVCLGEGEEALAELLANIDCGQDYLNIQNLWIKHNGEVIKNPIRPLNEDLDLIPFADFSFDDHYVIAKETNRITRLTPKMLKQNLSVERLTGLVPYEAMFSRGCPYSCTYCYSFKSLYRGQRYLRFRSVENMIQELELIKSRLNFIQMIWFLDDNIIHLPINKIKDFCQAYKERIGLPMACAGHPKDINEEKLSYLVDAGLKGIHVGIQTGSNRTQQLYRRHIPEKTILKANQALFKFKDSLRVSHDIIVDNPYETNEDIVETIKLCLKLARPRRIKTFQMTFFPGTKLYEKAKQDGIWSKLHEKRIYTKRDPGLFAIEKKYLNFIFSLLNRNVPNSVIRLLINQNAIFLLDRPFVTNIIYFMLKFLKERKAKVIDYRQSR